MLIVRVVRIVECAVYMMRYPIGAVIVVLILPGIPERNTFSKHLPVLVVVLAAILVGGYHKFDSDIAERALRLNARPVDEA